MEILWSYQSIFNDLVAVTCGLDYYLNWSQFRSSEEWNQDSVELDIHIGLFCMQSCWINNLDYLYGAFSVCVCISSLELDSHGHSEMLLYRNKLWKCSSNST